jgi:hypothetical protein
MLCSAEYYTEDESKLSDDVFFIKKNSYLNRNTDDLSHIKPMPTVYGTYCLFAIKIRLPSKNSIVVFNKFTGKKKLFIKKLK